MTEEATPSRSWPLPSWATIALGALVFAALVPTVIIPAFESGPPEDGTTCRWDLEESYSWNEDLTRKWVKSHEDEIGDLSVEQVADVIDDVCHTAATSDTAQAYDEELLELAVDIARSPESGGQIR